MKVGKLDTQEIDFVCYKGQKKLYIQVAYVLTEDCVAREFGNLEKIDDNLSLIHIYTLEKLSEKKRIEKGEHKIE